MSYADELSAIRLKHPWYDPSASLEVNYAKCQRYRQSGEDRSDSIWVGPLAKLDEVEWTK